MAAAALVKDAGEIQICRVIVGDGGGLHENVLSFIKRLAPECLTRPAQNSIVICLRQLTPACPGGFPLYQKGRERSASGRELRAGWLGQP